MRTGLLIFLALCVLVVGSGYAYLRVQLSRIDRLDIPNLSGDAGKVMNVLLVGSDTRETATGDVAAATGKGDEGADGQRSDTLMVLHVDPKQQKAAIVSIPRDLYVPIPGTGGRDKINASFSIGGPQLLIRTIREGLGVGIDHYVEVDFAGFARIVDTVGGVKVHTDAPARDFMTGLDIPVAGCNELDGFQALAFVRSRYYETYEDGRWVSGSNSDIDRIGRQQDFIRRMMKKAVSSGLSNPLTLNRLIQIGTQNLRIDQRLSTKDIATLARRFRSIDPDTVDMVTLPTTEGFARGAAVQLLDAKAAQDIIDRLNGITFDPGSVKPSEVTVRVLNGNGQDASASKAAADLRGAGFRVTDTGDADSYGYEETVVRYLPGQESRAALLRATLAEGATMRQDAALAGADVALVLGADYAGLKRAAAPDTTGSAAAPSGPGPETTVALPPPC